MTHQSHTDPTSIGAATHADPPRANQQAPWSILHDELTRGILHAINNRIAALGAFVDLATLDGDALSVDDIRPELQRLLEASQLLGRVAARATPPEPMELRPQLDIALSIHAHHTRSHNATCEVEQTGTLWPVRVPRWAILRLLLLLIDNAKKTGTHALIQLSGNAEFVLLHVPAHDPPDVEEREFAAICGAAITHSGQTTVLSVPVMRKGAN